MRVCTRCNVGKPLGEYHVKRKRKDGYDPWCKQCTSEYQKQRYAEDPDMHRDKHYRNRYGLTAADVDAMATAQNNQCDICADTVDRLVVDHCHKQGHVRALLCNSCNTGLGHFKDKPELLHAAADYIRKHTNEEDGSY